MMLVDSYGENIDIETTALGLRCLNRVKNILINQQSNEKDLIDTYACSIHQGMNWILNHNRVFFSPGSLCI